jgi:hypothetical protein
MSACNAHQRSQHAVLAQRLMLELAQVVAVVKSQVERLGTIG